ncbi:hypothetical protein [Winogradskyella alexanderae]|uniref:Cupin domain-containing protein n=1 Tax=Winogradskyella alexanderae TaxID=2877123 RepID=A0ABS7XNN5_9FLAO|nr:hypothetical protein [Winogradskyella alexanderae]MCA0131607.1 hypothetical protein [Winogradskyella alexanderae]
MRGANQILTVLMLFALPIIFISCKNNKEKDLEKEATTEEVVKKTVEPVVLFENAYAKVSKISLQPGESQPAHDGESRLIYALTDYTINWHEVGNTSSLKTWKKGEVHFHEPGMHTAENNGNTVAEWLVFSKKNTELPDCGENTVENDVTSVSSDLTETLFENDRFKLTQVTLPSGKKIRTHSGINRIIYSLSDYELKYESNVEGTMDKSFKSGDIHWYEACKHALENKGTTEAKFLVVSYKG